MASTRPQITPIKENLNDSWVEVSASEEESRIPSPKTSPSHDPITNLFKTSIAEVYAQNKFKSLTKLDPQEGQSAPQTSEMLEVSLQPVPKKPFEISSVHVGRKSIFLASKPVTISEIIDESPLFCCNPFKGRS